MKETSSPPSEGIQIKNITGVFFGDDQRVPLMDGVQVEKRVQAVGFVNFGRRNFALCDKAENAFTHDVFSF